MHSLSRIYECLTRQILHSTYDTFISAVSKSSRHDFVLSICSKYYNYIDSEKRSVSGCSPREQHCTVTRDRLFMIPTVDKR